MYSFSKKSVYCIYSFKKKKRCTCLKNECFNYCIKLFLSTHNSCIYSEKSAQELQQKAV